MSSTVRITFDVTAHGPVDWHVAMTAAAEAIADKIDGEAVILAEAQSATIITAKPKQPGVEA